MRHYPKNILSIQQQIKSYIDAGMVIVSTDEVEEVLRTIGFYRLRGYSFQLYDNIKKEYLPGTSFDDILEIYNFDNHDGEIPIWAAVEVMSFGTLSKVIKNLRTGAGIRILF